MSNHTAAHTAPSAAAARMRRYRRRQRIGSATFAIELDVALAADALASLGLLDEARAANRGMIGKALARFVSERLRPVA